MSTIRRLGDIAWAHSGDKGDSINLGVVVHDEADYALLLQEVTEERVKARNDDNKARLEAAARAGESALVGLHNHVN